MSESMGTLTTPPTVGLSGGEMRGANVTRSSDVQAQGSQLVTLALTPEQVAALQLLLGSALGPTIAHDPRATTWTWEEIETHLLAPNRAAGVHRRGLAPSTVYKTTKDLRAMAKHAQAPVSLWPPREETWLAYVRYRTTVERASETVLEGPRRALKLLTEDFLGVRWTSLKKPFWRESKKTRAVPPREILPMFWAKETRLHSNLLQDRNLKYTLRFLFLSGLRTSDLCALRVQDVFLDEGFVIVTEPKKRGKQRKLHLEPHVLTATNEKSLANYIEKVRPALDKGRTDACFLSLEGYAQKPNALRQRLTAAGRRVWKPFTAHCTRHRFATSALLDEYRATGNWNASLVGRRMGDEGRTVERYYLAQAELEEEMARGAGANQRRPRREAS